MEVTRIADGLWRWSTYYGEWRDEVGSVYVEADDAIALVDPLVPEERDEAERFWRALDRDVERASVPVHVLVTVFWHVRSAAEVVRRYRGRLHAAVRARAGAPAYVYQLDFASPVEPWRGAPHTLDIPLVFGTLDAAGSIAGTGADSRRLSNAMMQAFARFARTGDPNHEGLPAWSPYRLPARRTMIFDTVPRVERDPRGAQREIFARVPYIQPGT